MEEDQKLPEFSINIDHEAKLKELLRNLNSPESQLYSDASKEFIKTLKSDLGPEFLRAYVKTSSKLVEISQAWEFHKGKPGFFQILNVAAAILKHWKDNTAGDDIIRALDKFARALIEEKMGDLYKELNTKEAKRQNAVLLLLASIVRRNSQLAWEMAKVFDFKIAGFPKLAELRLRAKKFVDGRKKNFSTRKSFVGFAMSFLEVGNPRLLRGVLQQREMYSGVLRGLGNDDEETVVYVLSLLRDRILVPESLLPPGLRSVLFGSVTLEQLVSISGREDMGDAAELAYNVLVMVCTDPVNGLMPDVDKKPSPLRGNPKRLLDLMKKLKATEVEYHKHLLLAIVKGRPLFGSAYLDEFPYNLEDLALDNWFAAISLAADVVSSVRDGLSFGFHDKPPALDTYVQNILRCIAARPFNKSVITKGLLHADTLVKHGTLKLVVEALNLLDSLVKALDLSSRSNNHAMESWEALKVEIQDGIRMSLPDPRVFVALLSPLNNHFKSHEFTAKRKSETEPVTEHYVNGSKKLKTSAVTDDADILISGFNSSEVDLSGDSEVADSGGEQQSENGSFNEKIIRDLWALQQCDEDTCFYVKILNSLEIFHRIMPAGMEGLSDFFKYLPSNPLLLPTILQQSLLNLLNEHVRQFSKVGGPIRTPSQMYKHLSPFILLLIGSPVQQVKAQAYALAKAAILSTGAFDNNTKEIFAWFFFIPGYKGDCASVEDLEVEIFQKLSSVIVSFLCDAVSTTGNNLYKYVELLKQYIYDSEGSKDRSPEASPFIICVLEKCIRLLSSESGSFTIPQKSLISLYVCNTIKYLLDVQGNGGSLSFLIDRFLSEKLENLSCGVDLLEVVGCPCEWRPLKMLLCYARDNLHQQCYKIYSSADDVTQLRNSFINTLKEIKGLLKSEDDIGIAGLTVGFSFSLICTRHRDLLQNFPLVLSISSNLLEVPFSVLSSIFFLESSYLDDVLKLWPGMFSAALDSVIHCKEKTAISHKVDLDSMEDLSAAFACYLKSAPFCVLFSFVAQCSSLHLIEQSSLQKLLLDKVTDMPYDHLVSSLCNVLFWSNHARSCYRVRYSDNLEMLSELCFILTEQLLKQLLVEKLDTVCPADVMAPLQLNYAVEVAETTFNHPAVVASLDCPLSGNEGFADSIFGENLEELLELAKKEVHRMDHHILYLIRTVSELLFPMCDDQIICEQVVNGRKKISRAFKTLEQKLFMVFKNKFDSCFKSMDFKPLVPTFYALHTLICFISPFELLELVDWLLSQIDFGRETFQLSSEGNALFVGLHLASCVFDLLPAYMEQSYRKSKPYGFMSGTKTDLDVLLFERIFFQVIQIGSRFKLDIAYACLLKAVRVVKMHKAIQHPHLPSIMVLSRVMACTPVNIFSYCLHGINKTKAELLYLIAKMSPSYMSIFGFMFSEILEKSLLHNANGRQETCEYSFSDEELVMLLPTVSLYLNTITSKFGGQPSKLSEYIISVYGRVLLSGFSKWKTFVSGIIFQIGLDESFNAASSEEFLNTVSDSLLGKAILMVKDHLALSKDIMDLDKRLSLFNSVCPSSTDDLFDETGFNSLKQPLAFVNRAVAKINFCRMLLFPDFNPRLSQLDIDQKKVILLEVMSGTEKSRIRFLRKLINSWMLIVKKTPENIDMLNLSLFKFLEVFVMNSILELITEMRDCLIKLDSLSFIEQLVRSFLLYRFGDPATLKMLRTVLTSLAHGKFSCASVIQLLLAHSQFAPSIQLACQSNVSSQFGLVFTPMQSILRSLRTDLDTLDDRNNKLTSPEHLDLLELVKLVRLLFHIHTQQQEINCGEEIGVNCRELVYLLLSSYGATCSEVDLEIYNLILEIESNDKPSAGSVAQMDYLWGIASLKVRKDRGHDNGIQSVDQKNMEFLEENRKIKFRENLPVNPKLCAQMVLSFPYNRLVNLGTLHNLQKDGSTVKHEATSTTDKLQIYDPVFILRFSIHCLSMSYIEPVEFASLGLLAVTFASIASPDDDVRKLGYEALAKFKIALEKCRKKKDIVRLRLLMSYLQNGIEEPWQRIPSIIAVFLAEASVVLLDPSHDNYSAISKYLMNSPCVNMKAIPLFQNFFWSSSHSFKAERLWMVRLLYVGLNTEDDAQIYVRNSIFQALMSFYSSPLSDNDSKELIIQIMKKAVQLHKAIWFLVEHCGLILWLSSIVSSLHGSECHDTERFTLHKLRVILKVVNCITSHRNITEWLQKYAMEQLSELSSHLYKLLVGNVDLIKEQNDLCISILQILTMVLKISQKRKIYQPHFTLSADGLFQLYEAVEVCSEKSNLSMGLGLKTVLMSTPPATILQMEQEKLSRFLRWAVSTAIQSNSNLQPEDSNYHLVAIADKTPPEESLISKLLRWLTASAVLGKISSKLSKHCNDSFLEKSSLHTLKSWLGKNKSPDYAGSGCEEVLAASIFYLLQLLSFNHSLLPSAVSAICLLLLPDSSSELGYSDDLGDSLLPLCSKIHYPAEANTTWRWSYYQPWRDLSMELSDVEKLDEIHACERLLILASNILVKKYGCSHVFPLKDVEILHVYEWERNLVLPE